MRNRLKLTIAVSTVIILVTVAFLIAHNEKPGGDWVGISLHSLSTNEAQLVKESMHAPQKTY